MYLQVPEAKCKYGLLRSERRIAIKINGVLSGLDQCSMGYSFLG